MPLPLVSVILPVYNAAATVERAANSILTQTLRQIELIAVDDGSTDESARLVASLAARDDRLRLIRHGENRGLGAARNTGLSAARGRYIAFLDADDWLEKSALERAVSFAEGEAEPDLVVWGVVEERYGKRGQLIGTRRVRPAMGFYRGGWLWQAAFELEKATLFGYAWNKLYRASVVRERALAFDGTPLIEDFLFNLRYAEAARSMTVLDICPSHYIRRGTGLSARPNGDYMALQARRVAAMLEALEKRGLLDDNALEALAAIYVRAGISSLERAYGARLSPAERAARCDEAARTPLWQRLRPHARGLGAIVLRAGFPARRLTGWALHALRVVWPDGFARGTARRSRLE